MKLRVMSYNIYYGRNYEKDKIVDGRNFINNKILNVMDVGGVIKKYSPDIVGLNEVLGIGRLKEFFTDQAKDLAKMLGYNYFYAKASDLELGGPIGNAILSRYPIVSTDVFKIEDPLVKDEDSLYQSRCILKAEIDIPGGLNVFVTHYGLANSEKINAVNKTIEVIKGQRRPLIFMGDLNMVPGDKKMIPLYGLMKDTATTEKDEKHFTFPSDNPKYKIDYIFVSEDIDVKEVLIPNETVSDHRPYIVDIVI